MRIRIPNKIHLALVALLSVVANQLAATAASHSHLQAWDCASALVAAAEPGSEGSREAAYDSRHCDGCRGRPETKQRGLAVHLASGLEPTKGSFRLQGQGTASLRDRLAAARLRARAPPVHA